MLSCEFCEISKNTFFTEHRSGRLFLNNEFYNSVGSMVVAFLTSLKVAIWVRRVLLEDAQIIKREDVKKGETQYKKGSHGATMLWRWCWSVCGYILYTNTEIFPLFWCNKVARNTISPLVSFSIINSMFLEIVSVMEKRFSRGYVEERNKFLQQIVPKRLESV